MKYCITCLQPDTRPGTSFTANGQCPACQYFESSKSIDWTQRYKLLQNLVGDYRNQSKVGFDCIIGISGGKDSTRQALWVRDKLKLKPLLVCMGQPPQQVSQLGVDNISNLINLGFDVVYQTLSPDVWRRLIREGFFRFSNWARSTELAIFSSVPRIAISYQIPLIFWGENPALQVGDLGVMGKTGYDGNNLRNSNTLSSGHHWMLEKGFEKRSLLGYIFPTEEQFSANHLQVVYLGWFLGDWSLLTNANFSCSYGLRIRNENPDLTGDLLGASNLDEDWHNLNQMIKYLKYGFGKTTEYVCEAMRAGIMDRATAIQLVEKYDGRCSSRYIASFCDYLEITVDEFWSHVHKCINRDLFHINDDGSIHRLFQVGVNI